MKEKILVVDDEESLCEILKFNLEVDGYEVDVAYSAEEALKLDIRGYSLILLDVMMGDMSGFKMAHLLQQNPETASVPIIFCTAKDSEDDTITGLNIGADDYISKPFSIREVSARVKSVLRRSGRQQVSSNTIDFESLHLDLGSKSCSVDGKDALLTKKEFEILQMLMERRGKVFSRDEILNRVWGKNIIVVDRTIDVNITRLRKKIGKYGDHVVTRLGYGYGFE